MQTDLTNGCQRAEPEADVSLNKKVCPILAQTSILSLTPGPVQPSTKHSLENNLWELKSSAEISPVPTKEKSRVWNPSLFKLGQLHGV